MRAAVCRTLGPPEIVQMEDLPSPAVSAGEVRVRIGAAAVNFPDVLLVAGEYQIKVPTPFVPDSEFAGLVEAIGDDVDQVVVGERVCGTALVGAFAEEAVVAAQSLSPTPDGMGVIEAAAAGVAHRTAIQVLRSVARVAAGDELVVLGAGGGVGQARRAAGPGARRVRHHGGVVVAEAEVAAACGARHAIQHTAEDLREALRGRLPDGADVVVDPVAGELAEPALRSLRWGGRFVTVGYASGDIPRIPRNLVLLKGIEVRGFEFGGFARHAPDDVRRKEEELRRLFATGRVHPHVGITFPLDDVAAALRYVADGRAIGTVVLDFAGR